MGDYTSPLFGSVDISPYQIMGFDTVEFLPYHNRQDVVETNNNGQTYSADIFGTVTYLNAAEYSSVSKQGSVGESNVIWQSTLVGQSDRPACVLAIPSQFGGCAHTKAGGYRQYYGSTIETLGNMPNFEYYLFVKGKGASVTFRRDNRLTNGRYVYGQSRSGSAYVTENSTFDWPPPMIQNGFPPASVRSLTNLTQSFVPRGVARDVTTAEQGSFLRDIMSKNSLAVDNVNNTTLYGGTTIARLAILVGAWMARTDSVITDVDFIPLIPLFVANNTSYNSGAPTYNKVGTFIATGLPVFTLDSFDQMVRYFQGQSFLADNETPPPDDWSTDWDIYIKGAQRPDIYITMKSQKVDDWLDNLEDNQSGVSKSDIKVEYRYPEYPLRKATSSDGMLVLPEYEDTPNIKDWLTDVYNDSRDTDYVTNVNLNYPNYSNFVSLENGTGEFNDFTISSYTDVYAQLQFRIHYGKYKSAWCRYKIGVIGSPSVPDFTKMQNEGVQDDEWQDNSTVTLHYDEYPPGYDPYPTPGLPPMPPVPPDDTQPTPIPAGLNGIGLLTTTYKVTTAQAEALGRFFWGGDFIQKLKALNTSPIENVVGLTIMPIDIAGTTSVIVVGNVDTNINGDKITTVPIYTLGSVEIKGRYESFLDYEPYTTIHIFLPFVGFIRLDPVYVTGKTLEVKYSFDIINGLCNAMLFCDGVYVESHQGQCGVSIPLIASNRAELAIGLATSLISTAGGVATGIGMATKQAGKIAAGVSGGTGIAQDIGEYITGFHSERQGSYDPTLAWNETRNCFMVIESPNASYTSTYAHDKGRPCNASHVLGTLSGFTVCDADIDLSGIAGATEEEKTMIKQLLTTGVYL